MGDLLHVLGLAGGCVQQGWFLVQSVHAKTCTTDLGF